MAESSDMVQRLAALSRAARQEQFLDVIARDEAEARLRRHLHPVPAGVETVGLGAARGRVLAEDVLAPVDVPGFDRASVDGFAVRAADIAGATPEAPAALRLNTEILTPGILPEQDVAKGVASVIATGGMLPRGADAVVMVEDTEVRTGPDDAPVVEIRRPAFAGRSVAAAGSDIARGETVLRQGSLLTSREIGMLAAVGLGDVPVWRRPRVAILSTGDEIVTPGAPIRAGQVYDSNAAVLAAATEELGGEPVRFGIVADDEAALSAALDRALAACDLVVLSGGTSKGAGDLAHRAVARLTDPGIIVHGVALKPGKPLCLAVSGGRLVAILPGFPTSAIFTFHAFVAPVIAGLAGRRAIRQGRVAATLPLRITSERGRTEYVMVSLMQTPDGGLTAYPTAKGSGAVTSFAQADGFFAIPAATEAVAAGTAVEVTLIDQDVEPADLIVIGSHCVGLDLLIGYLEREGIRVKALNVGSSGGLGAARRGECDIAGIHLMDPQTGRYNVPFLTEALTLVPGYRRLQGVVFRRDDARFAPCPTAEAAVAAALADASCLMVNRNAGSGTRILIDRLLEGNHPPGYGYQAKSHNGAAVAVVQRRADWGVAIETVARQYGLGFLPLQDEQYDFVVPLARRERPAVRRFIALLQDPATRRQLEAMGFTISAEAADAAQ
ncbi:molybdopterin biosynthesis protein [Acidiphilium iwatense]|uniref:Molybdopterin molybdenumtransferase n=1 Tax=Acidiphilium iwatense TaxID=768198 RepID=A0ABS9DWB6_9PROT|nr:molybdopterin biosynthesis protein [Acidiphilium iwatense]MCF3947027.1 molybdopterin biosynthesis protein [Acidiphilium iwatense]